MFMVIVIYDSQTGFTEKMAEAVVEGARNVKDVEIELHKLGSPFSIIKLDAADAIILGSPVVYGSVTQRMKAFLESVKEYTASDKLELTGKIGGAFGSFAFSGSWVIRELSDDMEDLGMKIVAPAVSVVDGIGRRQPIRLKEKTFQSCLKLGRIVAEKIVTKS